jgi:hypothetical protein
LRSSVEEFSRDAKKIETGEEIFCRDREWVHYTSFICPGCRKTIGYSAQEDWKVGEIDPYYDKYKARRKMYFLCPHGCGQKIEIN